MKCPECNSENLKITDSRYYSQGLLENAKKRKRVCKDCSHSFYSYEMCYTKDELEKVIQALEQKRRKQHWTNEEDQQLIEMHKRRYRTASIAANLGRSHEAVRKRINILGIGEFSQFQKVGGSLWES